VAGTLRERRRALLREEILSAAEEIAGERGFPSISMDELAARAGISKPTLYSHFPTKEDVIVAAMMRGMMPLAMVLGEGSSGSALEQLRRILSTAVQLQVDQRAMQLRPWTPELFEIVCRNPAMHERLRLFDGAIVQQVRMALEAGEVDPDLDPAIVVHVFYAFLGALYIARFSNGGTPDPARVAEQISAMFIRALRPEGSGAQGGEA
jgi:AcrR family transcriptional regulator